MLGNNFTVKIWLFYRVAPEIRVGPRRHSDDATKKQQRNRKKKKRAKRRARVLLASRLFETPLVQLLFWLQCIFHTSTYKSHVITPDASTTLAFSFLQSDSAVVQSSPQLQ